MNKTGAWTMTIKGITFTLDGDEFTAYHKGHYLTVRRYRRWLGNGVSTFFWIACCGAHRIEVKYDRAEEAANAVVDVMFAMYPNLNGADRV